MGKTYERIAGRLREFIERQPVFFTATAPLSGDGTVNLSPKGVTGSFVVLDEHTVAYLDFAGSNAETIAHLRENGRITLMWCAFDGPPTIVRVHGRGEPVFRDDARFGELLARFPDAEEPYRHGLRAIIVVTAELVRDTCGYAVPFLDYRGDRPLHASRFARETDESLDAYFTRKPHVATSMDGLPGLPLPLPPAPAGTRCEPAEDGDLPSAASRTTSDPGGEHAGDFPG
ncbi:pyridoxamine 5'-phosphate oxidase family protein [Streptomyces sp. B6B3]|uniref:pyridoxamine 5'-phosphate oxidase family protein n=1 Tax=Streptomyces sp. B6B3 TaxID=3153570 RepID=UPI00325C4FDD